MRLSEAPARDAASLHARQVLTPWVAHGARNRLVVVRGEGLYLYDDRGKRYIDFSAVSSQ
jgi:taurine--2-oxoglutarate transaminase